MGWFMGLFVNIPGAGLVTTVMKPAAYGTGLLAAGDYVNDHYLHLGGADKKNVIEDTIVKSETYKDVRQGCLGMFQGNSAQFMRLVDKVKADAAEYAKPVLAAAAVYGTGALLGHGVSKASDATIGKLIGKPKEDANAEAITHPDGKPILAEK